MSPFVSPLSTQHTGHEIVERVLFGKATWDELWTKHDFFHRYHNYLQVVAAADDEEKALKWLVEILAVGCASDTSDAGRAKSNRKFVS